MPRLIPLSNIPSFARGIERLTRGAYPDREAALADASYEIVAAPGTHGEPQPPTYGWCCTREAAEAMAKISAHPPGSSSHRLFDVRVG